MSKVWLVFIKPLFIYAPDDTEITAEYCETLV
jgi:hypothetical protein